MFSWQEMTLSVEILLNKKKKSNESGFNLSYVVLKKINILNICYEKYLMVLIQI